MPGFPVRLVSPYGLTTLQGSRASREHSMLPVLTTRTTPGLCRIFCPRIDLKFPDDVMLRYASKYINPYRAVLNQGRPRQPPGINYEPPGRSLDYCGKAPPPASWYTHGGVFPLPERYRARRSVDQQ